MDVATVLDRAEAQYRISEFEDTLAFSSGMVITPTGIKFDGRLQNFMYRDVTVHRLGNERYRHYFEPNDMLGDMASVEQKISAMTVTNKGRAKDYVVHFASGNDKENAELKNKSMYQTTCLYVEVSPYSNVVINEHVWKDSPCKIFRIVYVVREGANLTLVRTYKSGTNQQHKHDNGTALVLESRIVQHPASTVSVESTNRASVKYLQDLFFVKAYKKANTSIKNRYIADDRQSVHCIADVHHVGEEGTSNVDVKSITNDTSKFTFAGNIKVNKEAERVDANLQNRNLQLSNTSVVVTEPKLDISTKEIACTHGCTVSSVDKDQLYLLNTRGFDDNRAKEILTEAFLDG